MIRPATPQASTRDVRSIHSSAYQGLRFPTRFSHGLWFYRVRRIKFRLPCNAAGDPPQYIYRTRIRRTVELVCYHLEEKVSSEVLKIVDVGFNPDTVFVSDLFPGKFMKCQLQVGFTKFLLLVTTGRSGMLKEIQLRLLLKLPLRGCLCHLVYQPRVSPTEKAVLLKPSSFPVDAL